MSTHKFHGFAAAVHVAPGGNVFVQVGTAVFPMADWKAAQNLANFINQINQNFVGVELLYNTTHKELEELRVALRQAGGMIRSMSDMHKQLSEHYDDFVNFVAASKDLTKEEVLKATATVKELSKNPRKVEDPEIEEAFPYAGDTYKP